VNVVQYFRHDGLKLGIVSLKRSFWGHVFDDVSNKSVDFTFLSKETQ